MKVVVHENQQTIWTTQASKTYRVAPEHVRPVSAHEAQQIPIPSKEPSASIIAQQIPHLQNQGITRASSNSQNVPIPEAVQPPVNSEHENQSEVQPDGEPEAPSSRDDAGPGNPQNNPPNSLNEAIDPAVITLFPKNQMMTWFVKATTVLA